MPHAIEDHQRVLAAIAEVKLADVKILSELVEQHEGHYKHELDLDVIVYGRGYAGGRVGPYLRLFEYQAGEEIIRQGDWGGNTFYIVVDGQLDVYAADEKALARKERGQRVDVILSGQSFGEMAILA